MAKKLTGRLVENLIQSQTEDIFKTWWCPNCNNKWIPKNIAITDFYSEQVVCPKCKHIVERAN